MMLESMTAGAVSTACWKALHVGADKLCAEKQITLISMDHVKWCQCLPCLGMVDNAIACMQCNMFELPRHSVVVSAIAV